MNSKVKGIIIVTIIAIFGFASLSFAGWRNGCGYGNGYKGRGMGWQQRGGNSYGMMEDYRAPSEEEIAKFEQQRSEFFEATEELREQLYEKKLALQNELTKENPDTQKASNLQQEISELRGALDQKRLEFEIETRKSAPNSNRAYRGYGRMMGYGYGQGGYCWR